VLDSLIERWGYFGVWLGTLLEGEGTLLAAGALAHKGLLALHWVLIAAFAGTLVADQVWFWVGRRFGKAYLEKHPAVAARSKRIERWLSGGGSVFVAGLRFLYGLRTASLVWLGASGYSYARFAALDTLGAALWAAVIGAVGWGLGAVLKAVLGRVGQVGELVVLAVVVAAVVALVVRSRSGVSARGLAGGSAL
jgi:membrane protein DedA with SNARE-associated domain